ncbi:VIT domain-containing protein [Bacteroides sp. 51]|uniref:VIT domain-containing protein n=1 Tax=Bacteroides sp. 51 TaxID=2302938 RepID=UPI0013D75D82|nr:VIT domain-containing protein [Bacteroides sp. 51]
MKRAMVFLFLLSYLFSFEGACQQKRVMKKVSPKQVVSDPVISDQVLPGRRPVIEIPGLKPDESPVRVTNVKIDVKVVGSMAVTTIDMIFFNPNRRILEGQFEFPLGEGQSISRFALDINGKLREGVVVDKQKGQQIFEDIIRLQVDPGLLEKTKGNNFRTRVYPLPAQGTRRIVIAYEQELKKENADYRFHLPVQYGELDNFDLQVTVFSSPKSPQVEETPWGKFSFDRANDAFIASYSKKNFKKEGQLVFSIPRQTNQNVFIEKGRVSGETYFYANVQPDVLLSPDKMPSISAIDIYWDGSSSMVQRDLEKELEFLEVYLKGLGAVKVNLYTFNIFCNKVASFKIDGDCSKLIDALRRLPYDGATQYGALDFKGAVFSSNADRIMLFSDGISTFGRAEATPGKTPLVVVSSQLSADYSQLNYLASATGGSYVNLMQQSITEAMVSVRTAGMYFISADYNLNEITDLNPSVPQLIKGEDVFSVTGKLKTQSARVTLHFGVNNKVLSSKTIVLNKSMAQYYDNIVERMWAQKQIAGLDIRYERNKEAIEEIGKQFNIVTRSTSLIVLDNVADYVRYEITPPAELLDEYNRLLADKKAREKKMTSESESLKVRIENVLPMFNARKEWWNKDFPKNCRPAPKRQKEVMNIVSEEEMVMVDDLDVVADMVYAPVAAPEMMMEEEAPVVMENSSRSTADRRQDKKVAGKKQEQQSERVRARIQLKVWSPDTPYMNQLKKQSDKELYSTYLSIKEEYKDAPSFYLDVASLFEEKGLKKEALIVLSNLAEMEIEDYRLLRVLANRLRQLGYMDYAISYFEQVLGLRPYEPQSYRDLGLAYASNKQYQKSVDTLYEIVKKSWDGRFPEIEVIALEEMNQVIAEARRKGIRLNLSAIDKRLVSEMPVDIRIVLNWDTDNSDMDLWVTDPCGEVCIYSNPRTYIGGLLSRDFTGGYGPEEFLIREAKPGKYRIQANYYGSRQQTLIGATTIYLDIYTYYSSGKEKKETITLRLTENKETIDIGEIVFERR